MSEELNITTINTITKKRKMDSKYYKVWVSDMDLLLSSRDLDQYIYEESIKIVTLKDSDTDKSGYTKIRGTSYHYYDKGTTPEQIKGDRRAKNYISLNLDDETKSKINFKTNTAFNVWKILKGSFEKGDEEKKLNLLKKLDTLEFDRNGDIEMFLSDLNNTFTELEELKYEVSEEKKFNYLYNSLPEDIAQSTSIITYQDKFNEGCEHLKKTIPRLKFLKEMKQLQHKSSVYNVEAKSYNKNNYNNYGSYNKNNHNKNNYKNNYNNNYNNNPKCYNCGRFGHISKECRDTKNARNRNNNRSTYKKRSYNNKKGNYKQNATAENVQVNTTQEDNINSVFDNALNVDYNKEDYESSHVMTNHRNF